MMRAVLLALTLVVAANATATWYTCQASVEQASTAPIPPATDLAFGAINCMGDDVANTLNCSVTWSGLMGLTGGGQITGMHIHGPAGQGSDAGVKWGFVVPAGAGAAGTFSGAAFTGLVAADHVDLQGQKYYFNLHTTTYGSGEIRCQMYPTSNRFQADLTVGNIGFGGGSVTGSPSGYGRGWGTFTPATMTLALRVYWWGLTGAPGASGVSTGVHLHGPAFFSGTAGVIQALTVDTVQAGAAFGFATASVVLTDAQLADLGSNRHYFAVHTATNAGGEIRGQLKMGLSANTPSAGTYEQTCTPRGADAEKVCMTVDGVGQVYWMQAYYKGSTSCGTPTWARAVNFTMATLGINQFRQRPTLGSELDMAVIRPWAVSFATASSQDISDIGSSCNACTGYNGNRFVRSSVMRPACPNTCELLKEMYGNFYATGATIQMTAASTNQATGWANTARTYYNFATTNLPCGDFVADVPKSAASAVAPSILAIAAAAILAALRV